jgi:hypothetical protein
LQRMRYETRLVEHGNHNGYRRVIAHFFSNSK